MKSFFDSPNFMPFCWTLTAIGLIFALGINFPQILQLVAAGKGMFCIK